MWQSSNIWKRQLQIRIHFEDTTKKENSGNVRYISIQKFCPSVRRLKVYTELWHSPNFYVGEKLNVHP
jgi:hypothetical protein